MPYYWTPCVRAGLGDAGDNEVLDDVQGADPDRPAMDSPEGRTRKGRRYVWRVTGVSECSKSCGGGESQQVVHNVANSQREGTRDL